ncbi:MAG: Nif3-like dinuclear metal center hexameric protein [Oscillospiraceae bacterium]|nr:Nif3-like dinuclear metal center hexameric protein [Oscillospiraceae bacterium]
MVTVNDVLRFIEALAPTYMKEDWDQVGLNCGHADKEVRRILVALDPFDAVCKEAKEVGADLLVTHHALLWNPGFISDLTDQGRNTLFLIENGIACINAHTNLDCAPGGVNDILAEKLGLQEVSVICPKGSDEAGKPWGLLRQGKVSKQSLEHFLPIVKISLGCEGLRYVDGGKPVRNVAVGGGACAGEMQKVLAAGCDTFVTADVKYNQFWDAKALGLNLIDAGHFHTENPVCRYLVQKLREAFPEITVTMSAKHSDCAKFF